MIQHAGHQLDDDFPIEWSVIGSAHNELAMKEGKPRSDTVVPCGHKILYFFSTDSKVTPSRVVTGQALTSNETFHSRYLGSNQLPSQLRCWDCTSGYIICPRKISVSPPRVIARNVKCRTVVRR